MLSVLLNKRLSRISRAIDMLCLGFGEDCFFVSPKGRRRSVSEYAMHFQTQWRFRDEDTVLLASRDVYEPYCDDVPDDWQYDIVGRPDESSSVFDVNAKGLMARMQGAVVSECELSPTNDVTIKFSNGVIFEQFMPASRKREEWRLIDFVNDIHTVCYDDDGKIAVLT